MTKPLVIFGSGDIAQLAHYYFTRDSEYEVVAFTVDRDYASVSEFCGLPLVTFDEVAQRFPPESHAMFVALAYAKLNGVRKEKYLAAKALGYELASYVSSHATVLNDGRIGENVFLLEDNTIQPFVSIGNNVTLWSGNHIGHHSTNSRSLFSSVSYRRIRWRGNRGAIFHWRQCNATRPYHHRFTVCGRSGRPTPWRR